MVRCTRCGQPTTPQVMMGGTGQAPPDLVRSPHYTVLQTKWGYLATPRSVLCLTCEILLYGVLLVFHPGPDSNSSGSFVPAGVVPDAGGRL